MYKIPTLLVHLTGSQAFGIPAPTSIPGQMNYASMYVFFFILVQVHFG